MADRFYALGPFRDGVVRLTGDEARHLARVARVPEGATVEVFDGLGGGWDALVTKIGKDEVQLRIASDVKTDRASPLRLTLAVAFPKGDRVDWLIEKATEIGVERIVPLLTERTVVDPRPAKLDRLRRGVIEAAKQCGRNTLMTIEPPQVWSAIVQESPPLPRWACHPGGILARDLPAAAKGSAAIAAAGPEGGFTDDEIALAVSAGWGILGLGATILRIETAALAASLALITRCG